MNEIEKSWVLQAVLIALGLGLVVLMGAGVSGGWWPKQHSDNDLRQLIREELARAADGGCR